ncbi:MAG: phage baseplate assembly protein V [Succinivibrio sp.]|jgi:phage baseplate assembly protein V|nr:phage baseplate assembly protein V [Succinivibrio sp.]
MNNDFLSANERVSSLESTLTEIIRVGTVSSTNPQKHTARVTISDEDNLTTHELAVLCRNTFKNHDYNMPDVGDDVLCVFMPQGIEEGFILGSFYAGNVQPPTTNQDERKVEFADGTTVTYNRATHELDVVIEGTHIHADRAKVNITTPQEVNINTTNANITASGNITMKSGGNTSITAGGTLTLKGSNTNIN